MKTPTISVVIVTYKSNEYIDDCLNSINNYNDWGENLKIVVVDNSPLDYPMLPSIRLRYPNVRFIENSKNTGFGDANNIGAAEINSDFILFLNPDTELIEPIFKKIILQFEENANLGCLGIKQEGGGLSFFSRFEYPTSPKEIKRYNREGKYDPERFYLAGSFLFFRRKVFERCGRFDSNIFLFCEEMDILKRVNDIGSYSVFMSDLSYLHKVGERKKNFDSKMWCIGTCSFYYYLNKHKLPIRSGLKFNIKQLRKYQLYYFFKLKFKNVLLVEYSIKFTKFLLWGNYFKSRGVLENFQL